GRGAPAKASGAGPCRERQACYSKVHLLKNIISYSGKPLRQEGNNSR
ncbi:hypothetical protein LEMLEM_LOCUS11393, partial [Lemmus lemmus]